MELSADKTELLKVTNSDLKNGEFIFPDTVVHIGDGAFAFCHGLTQVTIPGSVTHIGDAAFAHCSELTQVSMPSI